MRLIITLIVLMFVLGSCGKKSEPQYQGSINSFTKIILGLSGLSLLSLLPIIIKYIKLYRNK